MNRINIVGTSGSGKTTLARQISQILNIPHVELDALHWEKNWTEANPEVFRERLDAALRAERWVVDGNYSHVRKVTWGRADTVIFLDYPLHVIGWQVITRTLRRCLWQEELWNGNRENLFKQLFTLDSLWLWVLQTYWKNKRNYPLLFQQPEFQHLTILHFRTPRETQAWLTRLQKTTLKMTAPSP